jgi:antitoxin ParD1/3/4
VSAVSIQISLPKPLEDYVQARVAEGLFDSPSDYLQALVLADQEKEVRLEALRRDIDVGLAELDRGQGIPAEEVFRRLEDKYGRAE